MLPRQLVYQLLLVVRNPIGAFVSFIIPIMLLVALDLVTPEMTLQSLGKVQVAQFLTPAMASFAVLNIGFVDVAVSTTLARDSGILKRLRATPLPRWVYMAGRMGAAACVAALSVATVVLLGVVVLHAHLARTAVPAFALAGLAGLVVSCALGIALAGLVPNALAALPTSYGVLLPVAFISGVFFPAPGEAAWLRALSTYLPVQPFGQAMQRAFSSSAQGLDARDLVVLAAWTFGALAVAFLAFRWEPRRAAVK